MEVGLKDETLGHEDDEEEEEGVHLNDLGSEKPKEEEQPPTTGITSVSTENILADLGKSNKIEPLELTIPEEEEPLRDVKLMSKVISKLKTPKIYRGMEIDERMKKKIRRMRNKVLDLEIVVEVPQYDENGDPIMDEDEDDEFEHSGIFNAHMLEDEYLDQQEYVGETFTSDEDEGSQEKAQADYYQDKNEEEIEEDLKKHCNVDFGEEDQEGEEYVHDDSVDGDPFLEVRPRGFSLQALENLHIPGQGSPDEILDDDQNPEMIDAQALRPRQNSNYQNGKGVSNFKVLEQSPIGENSSESNKDPLDQNVEYEDDGAYLESPYQADHADFMDQYMEAGEFRDAEDMDEDVSLGGLAKKGQDKGVFDYVPTGGDQE